MTGENRRRNAADELGRADTCLKEARALHEASLPYGAASRAYYAVFHAARALLFSAAEASEMIRDAETFVAEARRLIDTPPPSPAPPAT